MCSILTDSDIRRFTQLRFRYCSFDVLHSTGDADADGECFVMGML